MTYKMAKKYVMEVYTDNVIEVYTAAISYNKSEPVCAMLSQKSSKRIVTMTMLRSSFLRKDIKELLKEKYAD